MTDPENLGRRKPPARKSAGLYLIAAYYLLLLVQLPFQLPLPETLPMGPFSLEGRGVLVGVVIVAGIWAVMLVGLVTRSTWGYRLAVVVLAVHILVVLGGVQGWLSRYGMEAFRSAWQVVVFPSLQWIFTDALALLCLIDRKELFRREGVQDVAVA